MTRESLLLNIVLLSTCFIVGMTDSKPIMVIDLFRHGARSAYDGQWDVAKVWNQGYGELTNAGMRQHYLLGKALAQDYAHLLGPYDPSKILVYSTDVDRTIMSAYSHLFGMFFPAAATLNDYQNKTAVPPGLENYNFSEFITDESPLHNGIQPVPVHIIAKKRDYALSADAGCKNIEKINKDSLNSSAYAEFRNITSETAKLVEQYAKQNNITLTDIWSYWALGDILVTNYYENYSLPFNITYSSKQWRDFLFFSEWIMAYLYGGPLKNLQLTSYNLFARMFDQLNGKLNGTFNKTFAILSAHESTLMPMLAVLGAVTPECLRDAYLGKANNSLCKYPGFASNIITELYNDTDKPSVKIKYNGVYMNICNNTDNSCSLAAYQQLVNQKLEGYSFSNWLNDCGIEPDPTPQPQPQPQPKPSDDSSSGKTLMILIAIVGVVCLVELSVLILLLRKGKRVSGFHQESNISATLV